MSKVECETVIKGTNYPINAAPVEFYNQPVVSYWIKFTESAVKYLYPSDDPRGSETVESTNKLWGVTRCGHYNHVHSDSDRFVWRRSLKCLNIKRPYVLNEIENCDEKDLIEIMSYTYDNGSIPYIAQNSGRLNKPFKTRLRIETWYLLKLILLPKTTIYELFDEDNALLETVSIDRRDCGSKTTEGRYMNLYFG